MLIKRAIKLAFELRAERKKSKALHEQAVAIGLELEAERRKVKSILGEHASNDDIPGILVVTLPKSGTVFLETSLCRGLGKKPLGMPSGGIFPNVNFPQTGPATLARNRGVCAIHTPANRYNLIEIGAHLEKMIVHVRDPRQAMISWCKFLPQVVVNADPVQALHFDLPSQFLSWDFENRLDWMIDHHLQQWIDWMTGWVEASRNASFKTRIMFTRHEDLAINSKVFFERILDFYGIDHAKFIFPPAPKSNEMNFRSGETQEWRRVMTHAQQLRATARIPSELLKQFDWPSE